MSKQKAKPKTKPKKKVIHETDLAKAAGGLPGSTGAQDFDGELITNVFAR